MPLAAALFLFSALQARNRWRSVGSYERLTRSKTPSALDIKELEMNIRPLLLGLPLLLTGCSTMSNFSWSSLSPLNWFGSSLEVSAKGVGELNAGTPNVGKRH